MNEIKITHELCAEDRARIDRMTVGIERLAAAVEARVKQVDIIIREDYGLADAPEENNHNCEGCVQDVPATPETAQEPENEPTAVEETETPATTPDEEETPDEDEETATEAKESTEEPAAPVMPVNLYDIQRKVIALSDAGMKAEVKAIVTAYSDRVSSLPEDKWGEVFEQLTALEKTPED